jgi:hypothetical protein
MVISMSDQQRYSREKNCRATVQVLVSILARLFAPPTRANPETKGVSAMTDPDHPHPRPFLLRFLHPLERPAEPIAYDQAAQVNMLTGQAIPAVRAGFDVKTLGAVAENWSPQTPQNQLGAA